MNFSDACKKFADGLNGTDSYTELKHDMQRLIEQDPSNAAAYYLIYGFAHSYILIYEDQAISPAFAAKAKNTLFGYLNTLGTQGLPADPSAAYAAINQVVSDYERSEKIF